MQELLVEDVEESEKNDSDTCSSDSNVFVFDYEMSLEDRLKDFAKETATAGPKLITDKKGEVNATRKIKLLLKKRFNVNMIKTPSFAELDEEEEIQETCSIAKQIFGIGKGITEAEVMEQVMERKAQKDEFYRLAA